MSLIHNLFLIQVDLRENISNYSIQVDLRKNIPNYSIGYFSFEQLNKINDILTMHTINQINE